MIAHSDLTGVDEDTARLILVVARSIAPCLDSLDGEDRANALSVLRGVAREAASMSRTIESQSVGTARVTYRDIDSMFTPDYRTALRTLCGAASDAAGHPVGSFPKGNPFRRLWPEEC